MTVVLFLFGIILSFVILFRWQYISDLIELRKPNYRYIDYLECKAALSLDDFIKEHIPGSRHFQGLHDHGLYSTLKVLGCDQCQMIYDDKGEVADEMIPCYTHVNWFDN